MKKTTQTPDNTRRDLRHEAYEYHAEVKNGSVFLMGNVIQAFWWQDALGRPFEDGCKKETWTAPDHQQALDNFNDMVDRWKA